jgi:hypothetical protein
MNMSEQDRASGNGRTQDGDNSEMDLKTAVRELSRVAFELAKELASKQADEARLEQKARELNDLLTELVPHIQGAAEEDQPRLKEEWTEARQDAYYVMSRGKMPTSLRLNQHLQSLE